MALIVLCSVLFWIKNKQQANGTLQRPIEGQEGLRYKLLACIWTQLEDRKHSRYSERCNQIKPHAAKGHSADGASDQGHFRMVRSRLHLSSAH